MNIPGGSGLQFRQFTPISGHKTRVNNTVNLYRYLKFCGNIMFTLGPNNNLWLTEATGMDTNGCDMLNDSKFAFFLDNWGCRGSAWGQNQELEILELWWFLVILGHLKGG
jgi:hypothetical protein